MSALRASVLVVGLLSVAGCKKDSPSPAPPVSATAPVAPAGDPTLAPPAGNLVGTVAERLDAPNYTYLRVNGPAGDTWAAVPTTPVPVGARVAITNPMPMQNFESKTLGRTFDLVMFGGAAEVLAEGARAPAPVAAGMGAAVPAIGGDPHAGQNVPRPTGPAVDLANIKVAKAPGADGRNVAEVYAQRAALKDKPVSVRGKVVKVTSGVLGRNWLHVRDGSGSDSAQDNDLIITTTAEPKVNDEVTLQGTVRTDKDLGSGYAYKVLVEDAKLSP